jgi:hypothetical protein
MCRKCQSIAGKKYHISPKGRETKARYKANGKFRDNRARFEQSEKGKKTISRYGTSEKGRRAKARFIKSERGRAYLKSETVRLATRLRGRLRSALKRAVDGVLPKKSNKTLDLLGCSIEYFKKHIEQQFKPGMTWERYAEFHIDHIKPCAAFDLRDPEQQQICFHYSNMQPLWAAENLKKGSKFDE